MWHGNPQLSRLNFQELWIAYFIDLHQQFQKAPWCWARSSDKKTVLTAHGAEMNRSGSVMMTEGKYEMVLLDNLGKMTCNFDLPGS